MKWDASTISHMAVDAGFTRPDLHTAVALALVSSGGHDNYDLSVGAPGCGRYVGLWAIDADNWTDYAPDALKDPHEAARACYELTQRCVGFGWSPAWQRGAERKYLAHAASSFGTAPYSESMHAPIASSVLADAWQQLLGRHWGRSRNG